MNENSIEAQKKELRIRIARQKKTFSDKQLARFSEEATRTLELTAAFAEASLVLIYCNLKGEVETKSIIRKYRSQKRFLLPVVDENRLILKEFYSEENLSVSHYGISEPTGKPFTEFKKIDLAIVPGIAFDRKLNRMGRGKGYYDSLLPALKCPKIGFCFDFQLFDSIPTDERDVKMNMIVAQNEIVLE